MRRCVPFLLAVCRYGTGIPVKDTLYLLVNGLQNVIFFIQLFSEDQSENDTVTAYPSLRARSCSKNERCPKRVLKLNS